MSRSIASVGVELEAYLTLKQFVTVVVYVNTILNTFKS